MRSNRTRPATDDGAAHYPVSTTPAPTPRPTIWGLTGLLALFVVLAGCGRDQVRPGPPPAATPPAREWPVVPPSDPAAANAVLMRAISLVGTPYRYGGNTPEGGFDCSGLVNYVFRDMLDLRLPRTSRELAAFQGPKIEPRQLAPADLVFFGNGSQVTHVGIYVGEGRFVHAPSSGGTVRLDHLDGSYWRRHYTGAKRVLR
ncbi:MAG: C40 family peptidase [Xanthomonadaceae bacterium]|uniref:NlpC/P60 family protein n=2 Tax=Luteimonas wenzhouensis TaxID=2599615 RepID=A0A5C5U5L9_9GAMM|nr:C40 family peptidase [Luteimonas wenzhouensis]NLW97661.1 C40 family peptidase [Xanthomonadaceae bacterium]TWT20580.1 NlpC/P60 family protein [Luteimonas wenzhouensis]